MEKGSMVGLGLCLAGVFISAILHGIQHRVPVHGVRVDHHRVVRSLGATIASFPLEATQNLGKYIRKAMKGKEAHSASETISQIVVLTNRARAEGLLALEEEAKGIEDPFFRKGIELAVDGTDPDALKKTLNSEIGAMKERHKIGAGWCTHGRHLRPDVRHHRRRVRPHGDDGAAVAPGEGRRGHRRRVRRDVLGRVPRQRHLVAVREQAEEFSLTRGRAQAADRRGDHGDPGRRVSPASSRSC